MKKQIFFSLLFLCISFDQILKYRVFSFDPIIVFDSKLPDFFSAEGICLFPFIFLKRGIDDYYTHNVLERLIIHEMVHFDQVLENGFFGFYLKYLYYWGYYMLKNSYKESYWLIPYEVEAHKLDKLGPNVYQSRIIFNLLNKHWN